MSSQAASGEDGVLAAAAPPVSDAADGDNPAAHQAHSAQQAENPAVRPSQAADGVAELAHDSRSAVQLPSLGTSAADADDPEPPVSQAEVSAKSAVAEAIGADGAAGQQPGPHCIQNCGKEGDGMGPLDVLASQVVTAVEQGINVDEAQVWQCSTAKPRFCFCTCICPQKASAAAGT